MTATTFTRLPLAAGTAVATTLGRAGLWTLSRYMRAPLASTGLLAMVTLTALAGSNALYFQTARHPAPFFAPATDVPVAVVQTQAEPEIAPIPAQRLPEVATASQETTGSVAAAAPAPQVIPSAPVGNKQAFEVQKKLTELGLFTGTVDGFYGPMTARAIRAFEERNGLVPTGALTPAIVDAILRADASGMAMPQAAVAQPVVAQPVVAPIILPTPVAAPQPQQVAVAPAPQQDLVVARLPELSPVDAAVDTVGNAAASTIDSIVAAVGGARGTPAAQGATPIPAMPLMATAAQPMPAQVASLEPVAAPRPVTAVQAAPVPDQMMAATSTVAPANNVELVRQIQRGLASLGFYRGSIDGNPGEGTAKAIREFENFYSYKVTGQINPDLVGLLRDAGASI